MPRAKGAGATEPDRGTSFWQRLPRDAPADHDSEREQAVVRFLLVALVGLYFTAPLVIGLETSRDLSIPAGVAGAYLLTAAGLYALIRARPGPAPVRRLLGMVMDVTMLSVAIVFSGPWGGPLYPVFLWITFGNGFRYGNAYLAASAVYSLLAFGTAMALTPFWRHSPGIAAGLLIGLVALPAYVASLIRKLTEAKRLAEEASRAKSRFLATMSHELRTPLNAVIGLSDLLRRTQLDRGQAEMVTTIGSSGRALLSLINDVLDLSKIESGRLELVERDFSLPREMADTIAIARAQADYKGLGMALRVDSGLPRHVRGDPRLLRQILLNLLANAVKFTEEGGVVLTVGRGVADDGTACVRFDVVDSGPGIPEADRERIFEAFTQSDDDAARRHGGTGLGLAIVKQLAERHGGRVRLDSTPGVGSRFTVELPLGLAETAPAPDTAGPAEALRLVAPTTPPGDLRTALTTAGLALDADSHAAARPEASVGLLLDLRGTSRDVAGRLAEEIGVQTAQAAAGAIVLHDGAIDDALLFTVGCAVGVRGSPTGQKLAGAAALLTDLMADPAPDGEAVAPPADPKPAARACRVLVAEDNAVNRKVLARILENAGHEPVVVDSGDAALDLLEVESFDVVLMDVNMPGESGIETVKMFRFAHADAAHPPPIIAVSADATRETRQACLDAGMADFLTKPIDAGRLLDTIARHTDPGAAPGPSDQAAAIGRSGGDRREVEVVDLQAIQALREIDDDRAFVREVVQTFVTEAEELLRELRAARAAGDAPGFHEAAHAIKSAAGNVGAARVRDEAAQLQAVAQQTPGRVAELSLDPLQAALASYRDEVAARLDDLAVSS